MQERSSGAAEQNEEWLTLRSGLLTGELHERPGTSSSRGRGHRRPVLTIDHGSSYPQEDRTHNCNESYALPLLIRCVVEPQLNGLRSLRERHANQVVVHP